ncbi:hypothetical protein DFJ73DRAFT_850689 [Zopfochytrium polystomum]|nr:hypothetical protein DFJ73DRAFT_850689 [Zopfochytrium polystomum]
MFNKLFHQGSAGSSSANSTGDLLEGPDRLERDFLHFLDDYGFQGDTRANLLHLSPDQKRSLINQYRRASAQKAPRPSLTPHPVPPDQLPARSSSRTRPVSGVPLPAVPSSGTSSPTAANQSGGNPLLSSQSAPSLSPVESNTPPHLGATNVPSIQVQPAQRPTSPAYWQGYMQPISTNTPSPPIVTPDRISTYQNRQSGGLPVSALPPRSTSPAPLQTPPLPQRASSPSPPVAHTGFAVYAPVAAPRTSSSSVRKTPISPPMTTASMLPPTTSGPASNLPPVPIEAMDSKRLEAEFETVLTQLKISGAYRDDVLKRTSDEQKRAIISQYRKKLSQQKDNTTAVDRIDGLEVKELDRELEAALSDPDVNLSSIIRSNILLGFSVENKRNLLKQYRAKKDKLFEAPKPPNTSVEENTWQRGPEFFIAHLSDRTLSLKALLRLLAQFRIHLAFATPSTIKAFTETVIPFGNSSVKGVQSLEIALNRVIQAKAQKEALKNSAQSGSANAYGDSVLDDELRLEAITCISTIMNYKVGMNAVLANPGIIKQILFCVAYPGDRDSSLGSGFRLRTANLRLRIKVAEVIGPLCLISDKGLRLVLAGLHDLAALQNEPSRFHYLVASMVNPFVDPQTINLRKLDGKDPAAGYSLEDPDLLWSFRASILVLIVGVVSAPEDTEERIKLRIEVESRGLRAVFQVLKLWGPPAVVYEHIGLYEEDREEDRLELEEEYKEMNDSLREPSEAVASMFALCRSLQDPERSANLVTRTFSNVDTLLSSINYRTKTGSTDGADTITTAIARDHAIFALELLERVSESISGGIAHWGRLEGPDSHPESRTSRKSRLNELAGSLVRAVEIVGGQPLHISVGVTKGHGDAGRAAAMESSDLQTLRALYTEVVRTNQEQKSEILEQHQTIMDLRQRLEEAEEAPRSSRASIDPFQDPRVAAEIKRLQAASQTAGAAVREELSSLHQAVATLTKERDELALKVKLGSDSRRFSASQQSTMVAAPRTSSQSVYVPVDPLPDFKVPETHQSVKPLQWSKVATNNFTKTIWKDVVAGAYTSENASASVILDQVEMEQLQELFKKTDEHIPSKHFALQKKVTLLDLQRARNMEILLGSLRVKNPDLKEAIMTVNDEVLTQERLNVLEQCLPTDDEIELVQSYPGPATDLGMAERFILTIASVPRFRQRLHAIAYRRKFKEELEEIVPDMATLNKAIQSVRTSQALRRVLEVILVVGNFLNGSSKFRGHAYGFDMETLLRLRETRAWDEASIRDRAPTVLHYVARRLEETDCSVDELAGDISSVEPASRVSVPALLSAARSLGKGIELIKAELVEVARVASATSETDWFRDVMQSFVVSAEVQVGDIIKRAEALEVALRDLLVYFGEDVDKRQEPPEDFFRVLWEFQTSLSRAAKENAAVDEKAMKNGTLELYSRKKAPTAMFLALQKKKAQLKPVRGMDPFSKRMTVRRPMASGMVAATGDLEGMGRLMREGTSFKSVMAARKTMRRMATAARGATKARTMRRGDAAAASSPLAGNGTLGRGARERSPLAVDTTPVETRVRVEYESPVSEEGDAHHLNTPPRARVQVESPTSDRELPPPPRPRVIVASPMSDAGDDAIPLYRPRVEVASPVSEGTDIEEPAPSRRRFVVESPLSDDMAEIELPVAPDSIEELLDQAAEWEEAEADDED